MSTDRPTEPDLTLTRLYRSLGDEAQYAPLPPPAAIRARADRQGRNRAVLAVAAAAVLVAGVAIGGNELLDGDDVKVVPAPQPSPSPTLSVAPVPPPTVT